MRDANGVMVDSYCDFVLWRWGRACGGGGWGGGGGVIMEGLKSRKTEGEEEENSKLGITYLSVCLSIFPIYLSSVSVCLSVYLFVCVVICLPLSVYISTYLSVCLRVSLSVRMSVCMSVYSFIYLSVFVQKL